MFYVEKQSECMNCDVYHELVIYMYRVANLERFSAW